MIFAAIAVAFAIECMREEVARNHRGLFTYEAEDN
jgi:hypothetical protein